MHSFHLHLYGYPLQAPQAGPALRERHGELPTLLCQDLESGSFSVSFEEVVDALGSCPRLFIEMDGSFVWNGVTADQRDWQIDGMLYDHSGRVQRVELQGNCPRDQLQQLLSAVAWPTQPLVAHLVDRQCFVDLSDWFAHHYDHPDENR